MPFLDAAGAPTTRVALDYRGGRRFQLREPLTWLDPRDGTRWNVPPHDPDGPVVRGNSTDLASVPPFLWGLVAPYGRQALPAVLHDHLAATADRMTPAGALRFRESADDAFRVALLESGVTELRAAVLFSAVGVERHLRHARVRGVLLVAQGLLGVATLIAAVVLGVTAHPWWLLLAAAPAVAALPWGRTAGLVATATHLAALYSPLIAAAAAASLADLLIARLAWLLRGRGGTAPQPGPTVRGGNTSRG